MHHHDDPGDGRKKGHGGDDGFHGEPQMDDLVHRQSGERHVGQEGVVLSQIGCRQEEEVLVRCGGQTGVGVVLGKDCTEVDVVVVGMDKVVVVQLRKQKEVVGSWVGGVGCDELLMVVDNLPLDGVCCDGHVGIP